MWPASHSSGARTSRSIRLSPPRARRPPAPAGCEAWPPLPHSHGCKRSRNTTGPRYRGSRRPPATCRWVGSRNWCTLRCGSAGTSPPWRWDRRRESPPWWCWDRFPVTTRLLLARSQHAELQLGRLRHHARVPRRVEDQLDVDGHDAPHGDDLALGVGLENRPHATARGCQRHLDLGLVTPLGQRRDRAVIHQPEVDDVDGNFRVEAGAQLIPDQLLEVLRPRGAGARRRRRGALEAEGVDVLRGDPHHLPVVRGDRVRSAERLRDHDLGARGEGHRGPARDLDRLAVAAQCDRLAARHGSLLRIASYSVDTTPSFASRAACRVCHARLAHLTRTGNSRTPAKTLSFPSSTGSAGASPSVTR